MELPPITIRDEIITVAYTDFAQNVLQKIKLRIDDIGFSETFDAHGKALAIVTGSNVDVGDNAFATVIVDELMAAKARHLLMPAETVFVLSKAITFHAELCLRTERKQLAAKGISPNPHI